MSQDIDGPLKDWEYKPGTVQARRVKAADGRQVIQMRVDLGILQLEPTGRPDGTRPNGFPSYFDYLKEQSRRADQAGKNFTMSEDQCQEADREFVEYYHRRICWLALRDYGKAMEDADHTLEFMDLVSRHSPNEDYMQAHEQYRGFVLFQRTQAAAALQVEKSNPEGAIDEIRQGLLKIKAFFESFEADGEMEDDGMVQHLRKVENSLREEYGIETTLQEQLDKAVANEEYETAARLRDKMRKRQ